MFFWLLFIQIIACCLQRYCSIQHEMSSRIVLFISRFEESVRSEYAFSQIYLRIICSILPNNPSHFANNNFLPNLHFCNAMNFSSPAPQLCSDGLQNLIAAYKLDNLHPEWLQAYSAIAFRILLCDRFYSTHGTSAIVGTSEKLIVC